MLKPGAAKSFDLHPEVRNSNHMNTWLPSLNALRAFEAAARHQSYKLAAEELNVTPAAVKQLVAKLEDAIGETLLARQGRGMALTEAGLRGIDGLSDGFRQIALSVDRMRAVQQEQRLIVSVDPSFAAAWLVPNLQEFKSDHPEIDVLIESTMEVADLKSGAADIGIRFGVTDHGDLLSSQLFEEEMCALCSPAYAAGPPERKTLQDLEQARLLRWDLSDFQWAANTRSWNYWTTWLRTVGAEEVTPGAGVNFNDYNLAVQAAVAGQGFVLGSMPVLQQQMEAGLLVDPFGISAKPGFGYDVVTTKEAMERDDVQLFVNWILNRSQAMAKGGRPSQP